MNDRKTDLPQQGDNVRTGEVIGHGLTPPSEYHDGGEIRFAPNFSVYVLPPDAVCLYSEDRKFFLHGQLYCELASRIGAGEPRQAIIDALSRDFPSDKI